MKIILLLFMIGTYFISYSQRDTTAQSKFDYFLDAASDDMKNHKWIEAISYFTKAIEINPNSYKAYYGRCIAKNICGDYRGVINDATKLIQFSSNSQTGYFYRGIGEGGINDNKNAIIDFTKVISIDPKDADAYFFRGLSELTLGLTNAACNDLSKAGELGNTDAYDAIKMDCH